MSVDPKTAIYLNIAYAFLTAIVSGVFGKPSWMGDALAHDVLIYAAVGAFILNIALHSFSSTTPGPATTKAGSTSTAGCIALVGLLAAFSLLAPNPASAATKTLSQIVADLQTKVAAINTKINGANAKVGLTGAPTTDANALVAKLQAISLADLKAAKADADGTHDTLASTCYAPLIDLVAAQQAIVAPGQNSDNPGASVPTTHLILDFQRGRDFYNALRPGSPVSVGCAPLAEQVKLDITTLIAQIAAGTLTMASFGL